MLNLIRNAAPGLFMIQAHRLFVDQGKFPRWLLFAFLVQLVLEQIAFASPIRGASAAAAALELMFGGLALYWALDQWPADLVEIRRRTRACVLVMVAVNMIAPALLLRLIVLPGAWSFQVHTLLSGLTFVVAASLLVLDGETGTALLRTPPIAPAFVVPASSAHQDEMTLGILDQLLKVERVYLEPDLRLSDLARRASVPEYRLRRLIHHRLGHRNFNAFLHSLRICEACHRLSEPQTRRTPILTIALSVGYGSVNSFNRGFREVMGCSPSDYRAGQATAQTAPETKIQPQISQSAPS